nr:hypothetical protein [Tanacetum cinerariifolium]GEX70597.1 hypothetical protein [Tanacetum cinerariifolium]
MRLSKQNSPSSSTSFTYKTLIIPSFLNSCFISSTVSKDKRVMVRLEFKIYALDKNFLSIWTYTTMMLPRVCNHHGEDVYIRDLVDFDVTINFAKESMKKAFQDMLHELGEVNPTRAYCNGSRTSKDNEDPSWNTSSRPIDLRRQLQLWKCFGRHYLFVFVLVRNITRPMKYSDPTEAQQLQDDCDVQATNIILPGLSPDVYALVNHQEVAKDIFNRVKLIMKGTKLSYQEREWRLYNLFDKFSYVQGETLYEYYWRFSQLINDMHTIRMTMQKVQVNAKFLNALPSEWSKFVTNLNLAVPMFQQGEDLIKCINKAMAFLSGVASRRKAYGLIVYSAKKAKECCMIIPQNSAFQTEDLESYDSNCDDISLVKAVLMENLSSCDPEVLSEESQDAVVQDINSSATNDLLVLSLVEQMTNHVAHLDMENQTKQAFWLKHSSFLETPVTSHTPVRIEAPSKLSKIAKPITPPSESASEEDSNPEQAQRDKDMQKNLALIAKYFKKIYKPTNNNLRTSSNSRKKNVDTTPWYKNENQYGQFRNQRTMNVVRARENIGSPKSKRVKDSAYHNEKLLLCKQAKKGVSLQAEQYDWLADMDEEIDEQELEVHYSYMTKIQEVPTADIGNDSEPLEKVQNDTGYNVFANDLHHYEKSESVSNTCIVETDDSNVILNSPDMCDDDIQNDQNDVESDDELVALANLIANLKIDIDENKKIQKQLKKENITLGQELKDCKNILVETSKTLGESNSVRDRQLLQKDVEIKEGLKLKAYEISVVKEKHDELIKQSLLTKSHYEGLVKQKTKAITDLKLKEEHDIDKMLSMEKQLKFLNEIVYKRSKSIQTIHMMAPKVSIYNGRPTFANPRYLKQAQSEIPCLYAFSYDQSTHANKLIPVREETLALERESIEIK